MADDTLSTFVAEAEEHLEKFNKVLVDLEENEFEDEEMVADFLRDLHSFKGLAHMVGLADIGKIIHSVETLIKDIRDDKEELMPSTMDLFFEVVDDLKAAVEEMVERGEFVEPPFLEVLLDKLELFVEVPDDSKVESSLEEEGESISIDPEELREMEYRELQTLAKDLGIKANQSGEELVEAIGQESDIPPQKEPEKTETTEPEPEEKDTEDEKEAEEKDSEEESEEQVEVSAGEESSEVDEVGADEYMYEPWDPNEYGELVNDFLEESREMLELLTNELIKLENNPDDEEVIDSIFRAAHTLKGSSGMITLNALETVAHSMEELLDEVREGEREVTAELIDLLLLSNDKIEKILDRATKMEPVQVKIKHVEEALQGFKEGRDVDLNKVKEKEKELKEEQEEKEAEESEESDSSDSSESQVRTSIRVDIEKLDTVINQVGELVINKGRLDQKIGELKSLQTDIKSLVGTIQQSCDSKEHPDGQQVSEDVDRISRVFQELAEETEQSSRDISRLISDLQESVMRTRMVPIAQLFNKYPRLVRDLSREKEKEINLTIKGEDTELDKTVIEKIGDPLMHIIRNAVDHGIESPAERKKAGKDPEGQLTISAGYEGDLIVIEIEDDGAGINVEGIKESAIEKGVLTPEEAEDLTDGEARKLIFEPGFSTAEEVTETSGRGVGMDVVMDNIRNLSGTVDLASVEGEGSTFTIRLPLTLAIIQVLIVNVGEKKYALPLSAVRETIRVEEEEIKKIGQKEVFDLRDQTISLLRLNQVLGYQEAAAWKQDKYPVVLVQAGDKTVGILVDSLVEKQEIVIKDLGSILNNVRFASGATIMGDGSVIIIIDISEVIQQIDKLQPVAPGKQETEPKKESPREKTARTRVLVVDDDKTTLKLLFSTLKEQGYDVVKAENGREAFQICQEENFDLISTDIEMPRMNGYEFVEKARTMDKFSDIPIIMVSSRGEKTDKVQGFDVGVDDYLEKPFGKSEFLRKIKDFL